MKKKYLVIECCYGSYQGVTTIEANDIYEAYAVTESEGHNASSFSIYDLSESKKLIKDLIREVRNAKHNGVRRNCRERALCRA